jgi:hypothetical protein
MLLMLVVQLFCFCWLTSAVPAAVAPAAVAAGAHWAA